MAVRVSGDEFKEKLLGEGLHLADFYSDSCVPCKMMSPVLADIEEELGDKIFIAKVNVAYDGELAEKYEVQAAPTLIFFKNGEEIGRFKGAQKKADLLDFINKNL